MINKARTFKLLVSGMATIIMVSGILFVWVSGGGDSFVSTDSRAIYKGSSRSSVALMFNVYMGSEYVESILSTLISKNVTASFFLGGTWAEKNERLVKELYLAGNEIGSHGYLHKDHSKLSYAANYDEMNITHKLIKGMLGMDMTLFAPPSGAYSTKTLDAAEEMGYRTILWSRDTIDWRDQDADLIYSRATDEIEGGELVLMHPTAKTAEALPRIIDSILQVGLYLSSVSGVL